MKKAPSILLLDTNIWLDNYLGYRLRAKESRALILECQKRGITLAYAATSIKDVFYYIGSEMKWLVLAEKGGVTESDAAACNETAWACVRSMTSIAVAATVAEPQVSLACLNRKLSQDFEDDVILATMESSRADYLVTNDETLCKRSPFPTLSSPDMLALLETLA